jgi:hypothetical protein
MTVSQIALNTTGSMTDLTPNDLSHLSDAEFQSLCPQGEHAPGPEPLSPAAQSVMDAFLDSAVDAGNYYATRSHQIAAGLRAVADQLDHATSAHTLYAIATELDTYHD